MVFINLNCCNYLYPLNNRMYCSSTGTLMRNIFISLTGRKMTSISGIIANSIRNKLQTALETKHLEIINESYMHNVPKGAETHFKVVVVSSKFDGLALIKRHRLVNDILKEELENGVHALSIVAKTPQQWDASDKIVESSPNCRGGFGK